MRAAIALALCAAAAAIASGGAVRAEGPTIDAIVPPFIGVGDTFEIHGSAFARPGALYVNAGGSGVADVVSRADDRIVARLPASFGTGDLDVVLSFALGASVEQFRNPLVQLHVRAPSPSSVEPGTARAGDVVVVRGAYFGPPPAKPRVMIGGRAARVAAWSGDAVSVRVPRRLPAGLHAVEVRRDADASGMAVGLLAVERAARDGFETTGPGGRRRLPIRRATYAPSGAFALTAARRGRVLHLDCDDWIHVFDDCGPPTTGEERFELRVAAPPPSGEAVVVRGDASSDDAGILRFVQADVRLAARRDEFAPWAVSLALDAHGRVVGSFSGLLRGTLVEGRFSRRLRP